MLLVWGRAWRPILQKKEPPRGRFLIDVAAPIIRGAAESRIPPYKLASGLVAFVDNVVRLDLLDDLRVVIVQRATALVAFLYGGVQAGLFDVPLRDFQMLINVHFFSPWLVDKSLSSTNVV